ncbi:MAG: tetratricopeptide (TPR) repeat protein [Planctomycetaceae bacterium]|jgi:tetratricopeptide (TPR) repeat protein
MPRRTLTTCSPNWWSDQKTPPPRRLSYLAVVVTLLLVCVRPTSQIHAQRLDQHEEWQRTEQYFDGLRSRGLFSLAETVCHRKLAEANLGLITRSRYAVELSRTLTQHSQNTPTLDAQAELLKQARQAVARILQDRPNHPQQILLESQLAFVTAFELEGLRWRVDLAPYDKGLIDKARRLAESVTPSLQRLDSQAGEQARSRKVDVLGERLQSHQLRSLQRAIQLRLGLTFVEKARLFPNAAPDRADALVKASEVLRPLAAISSNDQTMWQSQLAYATTLRLRGNPAAAWAMVNAIREDNPPVNVLNALNVEHVELLIAENRYTDAADFLREYQAKHPQLNGPLNFLMAQVFLRLSQIATEKNRPELSAELLQEVHRVIQVATSTGNGYWAARAQNLLADEKSRNTYGAEVGALVREGQSLFASGDVSSAAERYSQAFKKAQQQKANKAAAEIGYTFGSILLKQKQHSEAVRVFNLVTTLDESGERAADADLLAAWGRGMQFRDAPTSENREAYMAALDRHRLEYAESATAGEATWMLAQLQEQRLQTTEALKLYISVQNEHPRYHEAMIGIARCSETVLNRMRRLNKPRSEWEQAIVNLLGPYIQTAMNPQAELTASEADFLIRTSRILIGLEQPDFDSADGLLQHILDSAASDNPPRQTPLPQHTVETATGLRIVSLTGRGNTDAATELLKSTVLLDKNRLSGILSGLSSVAEFLSPDQRRSVGTIQLKAMELAGFNPAAIPDKDLDTFGPVIASAFEMTDQPRQAVKTLKRMLANRPKDAVMRRRVAELLLQTEEPADISAAQVQFRKLEGTLKAGSDEWMDARIHVIETAIQLKDFEAARKLLKVTQLLYPNPSNDDLKRRLIEASSALASAK